MANNQQESVQDILESLRDNDMAWLAADIEENIQLVDHEIKELEEQQPQTGDQPSIVDTNHIRLLLETPRSRIHLAVAVKTILVFSEDLHSSWLFVDKQWNEIMGEDSGLEFISPEYGEPITPFTDDHPEVLEGLNKVVKSLEINSIIEVLFS